MAKAKLAWDYRENTIAILSCGEKRGKCIRRNKS